MHTCEHYGGAGFRPRKLPTSWSGTLKSNCQSPSQLFLLYQQIPTWVQYKCLLLVARCPLIQRCQRLSAIQLNPLPSQSYQLFDCLALIPGKSLMQTCTNKPSQSTIHAFDNNQKLACFRCVPPKVSSS